MKVNFWYRAALSVPLSVSVSARTIWQRMTGGALLPSLLILLLFLRLLFDYFAIIITSSSEQWHTLRLL